MSDILITDGAGDSSDGPKDAGPQVNAKSQQQRGHSKIPDADECLSAMAVVAGLVAMKVLTPAQGNAIRASYRDILSDHRRAQTPRDRGAIADSDIRALKQKDPAVLNMLAPLFTEEQLDMILKMDESGDG